jgi:chromosomal replication initiation ATPase DnaA
MSLNDDPCAGQLWAKIYALQKVIERHDRLIDQQGQVLDRLTGFMSENRPTLREIIEAVSDFYHVTPAEIHGERHIHNFAHPRLIVYYLARKLTRLSLTNIGDRIGMRDHTTVRTGFLRICALARKNEVIRDDIDILRARIAEKVMERELKNLKNKPLLLEAVAQ